MLIKIKNILSFLVVIGGAYLFYKYNADYHNMFNVPVTLNFFNKYTIKYIFPTLFFRATLFYSFGYVLYTLLFGKEYGKAYFFLKGLGKIFRWLFTLKGPNLDKEEKGALLNILVKFIFLPLMFFWGNLNLQSMLDILSKAAEYKYTDFFHYYFSYLHWAILRTILFVDISIFIFGYALEFKFLGNQIKSVDSTFLGWFAALSCYPLYNYVTLRILDWYSSDFVNFVHYFGMNNFTLIITVIFSMIYVGLMSVYVWASISLGFKASNLTNRGIVAKGPYGFVRHPAYAFKNMARMVGALPLFFYNLKNLNFSVIGLTIFSILGWLAVYHLRAVTEERHLMNDPDYLEYQKKVKYRYIPGII